MNPHEDLLRTIVGLAAASADVVVAHVPRQLSVFTRWYVEQSDRIVVVVSLAPAVRSRCGKRRPP